MTTVNYDPAVSYYDETRGFRPGLRGDYPSQAMLLRQLRSIGANTRAIDLMTYIKLPVSCRTMVERRPGPMFRSHWALPAPIHRQATRLLNDWLERDCEAADALAARRMLFRAIVARF